MIRRSVCGMVPKHYKHNTRYKQYKHNKKTKKVNTNNKQYHNACKIRDGPQT